MSYYTKLLPILKGVAGFWWYEYSENFRGKEAARMLVYVAA